jgi:putative FmdB family regulatory protein
MPTYEYICDACEHEFEQFQSITADPVKECPECRKKKVRRKISTGAGIIFKGGGFYETDYRSKNYKESAKKESDAAKPASESKGESKSESKPASDAAPAPKAEKSAKSESKSKKKAD